MSHSICFFVAFLAATFAVVAANYRTQDIYIPYECDRVVGPGDHVLLEYRAYFSNGTLATSHTKPSILIHAHVTAQVGCTIH